MAEFIKKISDMDLNDAKTHHKFNATILEVINEGDPSTKRPIRFTSKMEESGEILTCITWDYNLLPVIQAAVKDMNIYELEGSASVFREILNMKISIIIKTQVLSTKKVIAEAVDENIVKQELQDIAHKYIKNIKLQSIVNEVLSIPELYMRPAACTIHHAFPGGLAQHTLNVTKNAMNIYRTYSDLMSLELLIAGSIIHDIGKIYEYTNDSKKSFVGSFVGHIPMGISILTTIVNKLGLEIEDPIITQLFGIISSHHGKIEYGSPNVPVTLESLVISFADNIDASIEAAYEAMININDGDKTSPIYSLESAQFVKMNNKELVKNIE